MKILRIIFTVLCAVCIALLVPFGMIFEWIGAGFCLLGAFLFFGLMLLCKQSQQTKEEKTTPAQDFMSPSQEEDLSAQEDGEDEED